MSLQAQTLSATPTKAFLLQVELIYTSKVLAFQPDPQQAISFWLAISNALLLVKFPFLEKLLIYQKEFLTTSTQIACVIPPSTEEKSVPVKVFVDEIRIGTCGSCYIYYSYWSTPQLKAMIPNAANAGDEVKYYGRQRITSSLDIDYVKIGDYRCDATGEDELDAITISSGSDQAAPCVVPSIESGYYSVSQRNLKNTGSAQKMNTLPTYRFNEDPYDFVILPKINSISNQGGSQEGQIITVTGSGFSSSGQNEVNLGGNQCTILSQSSTEIQCELPAVSASIPEQGYHAGLKYETFNNKNWNAVQTNAAGTPTTTASALTAEIPFNVGKNNYASKLSGYFKAPVTGNYKFIVTADDLAKLYISTTPLDKTNLDLIVDIGYAPYKFFFAKDQTQESDEVALTAGQYYYLELIHQQYSGNSHATIGVKIPNTPNTVNVVPEAQSVAITCPTTFEVIELKINNANGGVWRLRFDYLSADGRIIERSVTSANLNHSAGASEISAQISSIMGLATEITTEMISADGNLTTNASEAISFVHSVTFKNLRNNGRLPVIESADLTGNNPSVKVTQLTEASPRLSGTFNITKDLKTVQLASNIAAWDFESKLRELGFADPIEVVQYGDANFGAEWRIQFTGEGSNPIDQLSIISELEGCNDPNAITIDVTNLQESSQDLFYPVIPTEFLFTAHGDPQITVKSNGVLGNCPGFNCNYALQTTDLPEVTVASFSAPTLSLSVDNIITGDYAQNNIRVFLGNSECQVTNYDDSASPATITATCQAPEAGDFHPKVHFEGLGYASINSGVTQIAIAATVSSVSPTEYNPNGGTVFTVSGSGFPASLETAQARGLAINIGAGSCTPTSVTPTQVQCVSGTVSSSAPLTVTLNGKTASSSALTPLGTVPTISSVSPNNVNPVLQTDITITGTNFDATSAQTSVYLKTASNNKAAECLTVSSTSTQIVCKLLGAPTGTYSIYAQTSQGYSNSQSFTVQTVITSVSPTSGSVAGGTLLTITGGTFSDYTQQTMVFIGTDSIPCSVVSSSATQVTCITGPLKDINQAGTTQTVYVDTRIVESAVCQGTCSFTYSDSLTPKITALDSTSVAAGGSLQITGTNLDTNPTVTIGGVSCTVDSASATQIVVSIPSSITPSESASIVVSVPGKGYAQFDSSLSNAIEVTPVISSISPTTGSNAGALLTITGAGFQEGTTVKVGSTACEIRTLTSTSIICKTTSTGEVSLSYKTFTDVRCTSACTFSKAGASTPTATYISGLLPSTPSFTLTVQGSQLDIGTPSVTLISTTDKSVSFTSSVTSSSSSQITADFTDVAAGTYNIEVASGANLAATTSTVSVPLLVSVSSAIQSSLAGGATLSVSGSGFFGNTQSSKNKVTICGFPCQITSSSVSSITCETPLFVNNAVISAYSDIASPSILTAAKTWSDTGKENSVFDHEFATSYSSQSNACFIGFDVGANLQAELAEINFFPDPAIKSSTLKGAVIEGSHDDVTYTEILTLDANAHDGWNNFRLDGASIAYRYFRLRGGSSTAKCALSELQFKGVVLSGSTTSNLNAIDCPARVEINDQVRETSIAVNYRESQTPVLNEIDPKMGTSAGGTALTLRGSGFDNTARVFIDDIECTVTSTASNEIVCTTGAAPPISNRRPSLESSLKITFNGRGNAITNNIQYFYIDRWSDINTWGGITPPREGDSVSIPTGQTVLLDVSPPKLLAIIVEGALIFEDKDLNLECSYILINNGRVQIGTKDEPIQNKITITVHGTKDSPQLPVFGNKVIALEGGILDIHGKVRSHTWTSLQTTADAGATSIVVQGSVDWVAGEVIVIASTDHDHYNSESRTIATALVNTPAPGQTTLTFTEPLKHRHYGGIQTIDGVQFEMRAEVGLLTRNVVIQGDESSKKNLYGVHIMAHSHMGDDGAIARISYTEVRQAGQAFNMARYPIHFHLAGNVRQSYVLGNAIHHTYNRAVTIHGVHYLKVQKNVAYWVMGHTIFIEDGIETHNVIEDNLVINTMASMSLLNTDQTPASFWITNPNNIWRRNHAAGSDRYGFWFDLRAHPEGPSATTSICPVGERLGEFTDNEAHSNGRYGLRIFGELIPRTNPCGPITPFENNPPIPAEFTNFFGWKNMRDAVIGERMGAITFKNIKAADNKRAGIEISDGDWSPPFTLRVENAWIVGITPENGGDVNVYKENGGARGLITPKKEFFIAKNIHFSNFNAGMAAIETCSHCEHPAASTEGVITTFVEGLTFNNVVQRVRFNVPYKEIIVDNDGSLTGSNARGLVTYFYSHLNVPGCVRDEAVYNGLVCDETVTIRKVEFLNLNPFDAFSMQLLDIWNLDNAAKDNNPGSIPYRMMRKSWAAHFVTGQSYKLSWRSRADFNSLVANPSPLLQANEGITLIFNHTEFRETYDLIGVSDQVNITNQTALWTSQTSPVRTCGDWYHDVTNQLLHVAVTANTKQQIRVNAIKCRLNCPIPVLVTPKDGIIRLWSNATQWPGERLPQAGEDVVVPGEWTLKMDISPPSLGFLHIKGDFYFDEFQDDLVLTAQRIWVEGQLFIGNNTDERYSKNAKILLTGTRNSETLIIGPVQDVSNKVLAVTGNVTMYGNLVNTVYTRLSASVQPGENTITVDPTIDWKVGDEIFISPTQRAETEFETHTITAIDNGVITLDSPIQFYHFGAATATKETPVGTLDMRAEVGLLTRNIKVEGTDEDFWGARVYIGEIYDPYFDYYYRGRADLDGVELKNVGQANTTLAGLAFDLLTTGNNDISTVRRCAIRDSQGYSLRISQSTGVTLENNVFYKSYKHQLKFDGSNARIIFRNNLAVGNRDRGIKADKGDNSVDLIALLYSETNFINSEFSNNIFAGCEQNCVIARGGACNVQSEGPYTFFDNVVHSGETGWLVSDPNEECNGISHYTGYKLEQGIATFFKSRRISASHLIITDTEIGVSLNTGGIFAETSINLYNSYFAGVSSETSSYFNKQECSNHAGIYLSVSTTGPKSIPPTASQLPWYKVKTDHIFKATFSVSSVTFENFKDNYVPGCVNNHIFATNPYASDASASTFTSNLDLINVDPESIVFFNYPSDDWIGIDDCGGWYCTGINNAIIKDTDGTLTGQSANLIPLNKGVFDPNTCTASAKQNAYICTEKEWGLLTFESLDADFNTRIISPIYVYTNDGFENKLNSYMDHGWDGFYTSLKRMSRFHSVVQSDRNYGVNFTGTIPNGLKWQLQGASGSESVVVEYGYTNPQSVRVTNLLGDIIKPKFIQSASETNQLADTDPCGANIYEIQNRRISLKLTGDQNCVLAVNLVNSIQASVRYDISISEFFAQNGPAAFIDKVAAILNINPASIRIVEIRSGSTIIEAFIDSRYQESTYESDLAARNELNDFVSKLEQAASGGELSILGAGVLDASFRVSLVRESQPETITSKTKIIIIVCSVVGGLALIAASYFIYSKYNKKKIAAAKAVTQFEPKSNKLHSMWINTDNPFAQGSRFGLEVSVDQGTEKPGSAGTNFDHLHSPSKSPLTGSITPEISTRTKKSSIYPEPISAQTPETGLIDFSPEFTKKPRSKIAKRDNDKVFN